MHYKTQLHQGSPQMRRNSSSNANLKGCLSGTSCKFKFGRAPCFVRASHRATRASDNIVSGKGLVLVLCFLHASSKSNFRGSKCSYKMRCSAAKSNPWQEATALFCDWAAKARGSIIHPHQQSCAVFPMSSAMSGGPMPPNLLPKPEGSKAARAESKGPTAGAAGLRSNSRQGSNSASAPAVTRTWVWTLRGSANCRRLGRTHGQSNGRRTGPLHGHRGPFLRSSIILTFLSFRGKSSCHGQAARQRWQTCSYPQPPLHFPLLNLKADALAVISFDL